MNCKEFIELFNKVGGVLYCDYNKNKLVPFGEYTPWYNSLLKLAENLNIPLSNLSSGPERIEKISFGNINIIPMTNMTFPSVCVSF